MHHQYRFPCLRAVQNYTPLKPEERNTQNDDGLRAVQNYTPLKHYILLIIHYIKFESSSELHTTKTNVMPLFTLPMFESSSELHTTKTDNTKEWTVQVFESSSELHTTKTTCKHSS